MTAAMIRKRPRPPLDALQPQRICLIKPSALGDIIQTLPVLSALRARWPCAHITWVVKDSFADLLTDHPEIDDLIRFDDHAGGIQFLRQTVRLIRELHHEPYDLAIDLQGLLRSGAMSIASGAKRRIGFSCGREGSTWCYTDILPVPPRDIPVTQRYWKVVSALGGSPTIPPVRIGILPEHRIWAERQLRGLPRPLLAIHPSAGWETKRWPAKHFARLAAQASSTYGVGIVLVGGPDAAPRAREITELYRGPLVDLTGRTTLRQLAAVTERASVVLSGDSGPMHLAAALGKPVVSVFTCTNVVRHAPLGQEHRVVATQVACRASHKKVCPLMVCMDELTPFRVWPMLSRTLQEAAEGAVAPAIALQRAVA